MLQSLIAIVERLWGWLIPCEVLDPYERGVTLRLGKFIREVGPGLHFYWPLGIGKILKTAVVPQTLRLPAQSVTTKDESQIVISGIVKYKIRNVRAFLLDIFETEDALEDVAAGAIRFIVGSMPWSELRAADLDDDLTKAVQKEVGRWGIEVIRVTLADFGRIFSVRLLQAHVTPKET